MPAEKGSAISEWIEEEGFEKGWEDRSRMAWVMTGWKSPPNFE